jgi:starch synthase
MVADAYDAKTSLPRPLRVLMVSAELAPFARAGGLGDVIQGLSRALGTMGVEIVVVAPAHASATRPDLPTLRPWPRPIWVALGGDVREVGVLETMTAGDVRVLLLDCPTLFRRAGIYGDDAGPYPDNDLRFAVLSAAALQASEVLWDGPPDVLHAHDWHAALAIAYARLSDQHEWRKAASVFTFHNLAFQGTFPTARAAVLGLPEAALHDDGVCMNDQINFLKAGITFADRVTTVSPTYAQEVLRPEHGCGLDHVLRSRSTQLIGITNGIDTSTWDPSRDRALAARYDAIDPSGRQACRTALAAELGLDTSSNAPIIGAVSRLTWQKGIDMLLDVIPALVAEGMRFALVAVGDAEMERRIAELAARWPTRVAFRPVFGDPIARRVYAGADIFIMPSRFEPCGLGQQYAMRYGSVPVVSAVGGLVDTVRPVDEQSGQGTGFRFDPATPANLADALRRAVACRRNDALWARIVRNCLLHDTSWDASARQYFALYRSIAGAPPRPSLPPPRPVSRDDGPG